MHWDIIPTQPKCAHQFFDQFFVRCCIYSQDNPTYLTTPSRATHLFGKMTSSGWYPRKDGNYSSWLPVFNEKIDQYCKTPGSFENGVSVFSNGASKSLFGRLYSQSGVDSLTRAIETHSLPEYFGGKVGMICYLVISLIAFILSIVLACSLFKCFRDKFLKCGGACNDRPRYHPRHFAVKLKALKITAICVFCIMFAVSVVSLFYAANLSYGTNSLACDFWSGMRGHYFGARDFQAPAGVSTDWKGSNPQWVVMNQLKHIVNPKPEGARPLQFVPDDDKATATLPVCPLCQQIIHEFNGTGGFVEAVDNNRKTVMKQSIEGAFLDEAMAWFIKSYQWPKLDSKNTVEFKFSRVEEMKFQYGSILPALLKKYAVDLDATTDRGIGLFEKHLDIYLGRDSMMLSASYETADNSVVSLGDVDSVMAKVIMMWDASVWPMIRVAFKIIIAITCVLGILAVFFSIAGTTAFLKLSKDVHSSSIPSSKIITGLGVTYVILLIFSGFSFFMSSILLFAGSAGSDGCGFVDTVAFDEGNWKVFPASVWNETITGLTDIPTVLDTCVKRTGDGDVAASLGLRMSLDKLEQAVDTLQAKLLSTVNKELDLEFKNLKTHSLADMTKTFGILVHPERPLITVHESISGYPMRKQQLATTGIDQVMPYVDVPDIARITALNGFFSGNDGGAPRKSEWPGFIVPALRDFFPKAVSSKTAFNRLMEILKTVPAGDLRFDQICSPYLEKAGLCSADVTNPKIFVIDGTVNGPGLELSKNPFADSEFQKFLKKFQGEGNAKNLLTLIQTTAYLILNDLLNKLTVKDLMAKRRSFATKIFKSSKELLGDLPERLKNADGKIYIDKVLEVMLPNLECNRVPREEDISMSPAVPAEKTTEKKPFWHLWKRGLDGASVMECTLAEVLAEFRKHNEELAEALLGGFNFANHQILNFVTNTTMGKFHKLLNDADRNLEDFNCQFVGTSMQQGVVSGLCGVVMPSVVSLGLAAIFLWIVSGLGALMTWKVYHYYKDLDTIGEVFIETSKLSELHSRQ